MVIGTAAVRPVQRPAAWPGWTEQLRTLHVGTVHFRWAAGVMGRHTSAGGGARIIHWHLIPYTIRHTSVVALGQVLPTLTGTWALEGGWTAGVFSVLRHTLLSQVMVPQLPGTLEFVTCGCCCLTLLAGSHTLLLCLKVVVVSCTSSIQEVLTQATGAIVAIAGEGTKARTTRYGELASSTFIAFGESVGASVLKGDSSSGGGTCSLTLVLRVEQICSAPTSTIHNLKALSRSLGIGPLRDEGRARELSLHRGQAAQLWQLAGTTGFSLARYLPASLKTCFLGAQDEAIGAAADVAVIPPRCSFHTRLLHFLETCHLGAESQAIPTGAPVTVSLPGGVSLTLWATHGIFINAGSLGAATHAVVTSAPVAANTPA